MGLLSPKVQHAALKIDLPKQINAHETYAKVDQPPLENLSSPIQLVLHQVMADQHCKSWVNLRGRILLTPS
jgi:hypothetical protein